MHARAERDAGIFERSVGEAGDARRHHVLVAAPTPEARAAAIKAAEVEAMSRSIAAGGLVYLVSAGILFAAYLLARRPSPTGID